MLLQIDSTWEVAIFVLVMGIIGWLLRYMIKSIKDEIKANREQTIKEALVVKNELTQAIIAKRQESHEEHEATKGSVLEKIKEIHEEHKRDFSDIKTVVEGHIADDRTQFSEMRNSIEKIVKDTSESKGMLTVLVKDAKISFEK